MSTEFIKRLNAVYMTEPTEAVIGGIYGFTGSFDPAAGTTTEDPVATAQTTYLANPKKKPTGTYAPGEGSDGSIWD